MSADSFAAVRDLSVIHRVLSYLQSELGSDDVDVVLAEYITDIAKTAASSAALYDRLRQDEANLSRNAVERIYDAVHAHDKLSRTTATTRRTPPSRASSALAPINTTPTPPMIPPSAPPRSVRLSSPERFELSQLRASGVVRASASASSAADSDDLVAAADIELNDDPPPFLRGALSVAQSSSPLSVVRNPAGTLARAALTQSALSKERREIREEAKSARADALPADLARAWEDPMAKAADRHLAQAIRNVGRAADAEAPLWKETRNTTYGRITPLSVREQRDALPIAALKAQLVAAVDAHQILVVIGDTGSGKTTQMTQFLHERGYTRGGVIACTQPRRVAAMSVAKRVAEEFGCKLGSQVGYAIRFEDCTSKETIIKYMTEGTLLRELLIDPLATKYSVVMLDEAHERSINTDVLFGLLKAACAKRKSLKLIVTSATLDAEKFCAYFHRCPVFSIPGRLYPVTVLYSRQAEQDYLDAALITVMQIHLVQPPGDILLFLTGKEEIDTACCAANTSVLVYAGSDTTRAPVPRLLCDVDPAHDSLVAPDFTPRRVLVFQRRRATSLKRVVQSRGQSYAVTPSHILTLRMFGFPPAITRGHESVRLEFISKNGVSSARPMRRERRFVVDVRASASEFYFFTAESAQAAMSGFVQRLSAVRGRFALKFDAKSGGRVQYLDANRIKRFRRFPLYRIERKSTNTYRSLADAQRDAERVLDVETARYNVLRNGDLIDIALTEFALVDADIRQYFFGAKARRYEGERYELSAISIEDADGGEYIKLQIDGADGRFLLADRSLTHNCEILFDRMQSLGKNAPPLIVLPVYSSLPSELQSRIFDPPPLGSRKCVIATNIAEASLTIDGILYVVDPGFCKQKVYNNRLGMDSLMVTPISQASAQQRSGRAGRTAPGKCFRLYTEAAYKNEMLPNTVPEIQRTNLAMTVLTLKAMGINDLIGFDFMDAPPPQTLITALQTLYQLGALDDEGLLTRLGRKMAEFPLEPQMSKMLIASAEYGCSHEIVTIVAMLSVQSVFFRPKDKQAQADAKRANFFAPEGDHITMLNVYERWSRANFSVPWCHDNFLQSRQLRSAQDIASNSS